MTVTVLAAPHIQLKHRNALREIDMAPAQSQSQSQAQAQARPAAASGSGGGRAGRSSVRLNKATQEKGEVETNGGKSKRKAVVYDEDIEGFQFTRLPNKKSRPSVDAVSEKSNAGAENPPPQQRTPRRGRPPKKKPEAQQEGDAGTEVKEKRAEGAGKRQTRGSMRGTEAAVVETQPESAIRSSARKRDDVEPAPAPKEKKRRKGRPSKSDIQERNGFVSPEPQQSGTAKITLPLADTPVIQRNKEMRKEGKGEKGSKSRRSSLGMRGRRASSLIDSGASNALPHKEVGTGDFYKHIADGLPEPRRMRQLLTWCATRALSAKPKGARPEDASARLAARVIQEELLKDFSTNSELSNWFGREDMNPPAVVVKKPNPKNLQNADKIKELEEQIQRLQRERHSLNELLRPPSIPRLKTRPSDTADGKDQASAQLESGAARKPPHTKIDLSLLEPSQQEIYAMVNPTANKQPKLVTPGEPTAPSQDNNILPPMTPSVVSARLSRLTTSLAPTLDSFAAGVHDIELYRSMSDAVSSRVLRICAERLEERDASNAMRRLIIEGEDADGKDASTHRPRPREDLGVILGALSRVERR